MNSEVEIIGMTDDLYYIRHGKNYGFLPKNHLREKARGNFPFEVEIDMSGRKFDQQVREQNFLHEFLKSSQPVQPTQLNVNETKSEPAKTETLPAPVNEPSQENIVQPIVTDKPLDIPLDKEPEVKPVSAETDDDENDSGIDEEDDEDDEEEDENSEEVQQPELVAIPPGRDTDQQKVPESTNEILKEEKPLALPVAASSVSAEEIPTLPATPSDSLNETLLEAPKVLEAIPEFIPIKPESVVEAANFLDAQNETLNQTNEVPAVVQEEINVVETVLVPEVVTEKPLEALKAEEPKPQVESNIIEEPLKVEEQMKVEEQVKVEEPAVKIEEQVKVEEQVVKVEEQVKVEEPVVKVEEQVKVEEPAPKVEEPAPVTENISELPLVDIQSAKPEQIPEVQVVTEIPNVEVVTEIPAAVEVTTEVPAPIEVVPEIPEPVEVTTETQFAPLPPLELPAAPEVPQTIEIPQTNVVEPEALPIQQLPPARPEPDALLKRFNEKLGNKIVEGTGKGSVESLNRHQHDTHNHDHHGHDHHSHGHEDHHHHQHEEKHEEKAPEAQEEKTPDLPQVVEDDKPGFFGGLFKKFFSDEDDSEQHFHDQAKAENKFNTPTEQSGEFTR